MVKAKAIRDVSKLLVASYVLDWIVIIAIAAVGGALNFVKPNMKPFSLDDPAISYPYRGDTVSTWLLIVVSLVAPALIISILTLTLVPGPTIGRDHRKTRVWALKLWELHTGLAGLCLACALALLVTDGMKQLIGKPRPNMLSRCMPDIANAQQYAVTDMSNRRVRGALLVTSAICQQTDTSTLYEGFRSFPSGHSSFSSAAFTYLTLFACAKFAIAIPFTTYHSSSDHLPSHDRNNTHSSSSSSAPIVSADDLTSIPSGFRHRAATPPNHLLIIALIPIGAAIYITGSRYADNQHAGWDLTPAFLEGLLIGWFAFRWYHLPVRAGAGWSWGPRRKEAAFGVGVGVEGYATREGGRERGGNGYGSGNGNGDGTESYEMSPPGREFVERNV